MRIEIEQNNQKTVLIKRCHVCHKIIESLKEVEECPSCHKHFLPLNAQDQMKSVSGDEFRKLFALAQDIPEDNIIKGIHVLW